MPFFRQVRDVIMKKKKKMLFIYNPRAGKAQIRSNLLDIIDIFTKADFEVTAHPTQARGDGMCAVRERRPGYYDLIACCGGDGTLDEVVTGMMECENRIPIGYVPAGSTNDFANSLLIPRNMIDAAQVIVEGSPFGCDVGTFNDDYFVYIAAFGIFTEVSYEAYRMKVESEELTVEGEFMYGMITNSTSVGGFKNITGKNVELNDGQFEVTLIKKPSNPLELNQIMASLLNRNINTDNMYCFKTSTVRFLSKEEVAWTLDGEFGGKHREVVISNQREALHIIVPEKTT